MQNKLLACICIFGVVVLSSVSLGARAQAQSGAATTSPSWKAVQTAAQKEGKVVIYGQALPTTLARLKTDFEKTVPGITFEFVRMSGSAIIAKIEQERSSGADGADVLQQTEMAWFQARAKEGSVRSPLGPAARTWPAAYMVSSVAPILAIEPFGLIVYNTNTVKGGLESYADLLKPEFKGSLAVGSPGNSPAVIAWYDWLEQTQGTGFLGKLAAQNPRLYTSALPGAQAVASGEIKVYAYANLAAVKPLIEQGAPLKVPPIKPTLAIAHGAAVLGWSRRPNAAQILLDYLMSERGQTVWTGQGEYASPLKGIPGSLDSSAMNAYDQSRYTREVIEARAAALAKLFRGN